MPIHSGPKVLAALLSNNRSNLAVVPTKRRPTPEERDERVKLPLPADQAIEAILATGPHPQEPDNEKPPAE